MNIKKKIISYIISSVFIFTSVPIVVNAEVITVDTTEVLEKKYVSLADLTTAYDGTIIDNSDVNIMIYNINGKSITVNSKSAFVSVDNNLIPLETKEIDGIIVPNFTPEKPTADTGEILFPVSIIEDYVGIKCTDEGFTITMQEVDEEESTETYDTNSYESPSYYYEEFYIENQQFDEYEETPTTNYNISNTQGSNNNSSSSGQTAPKPTQTTEVPSTNESKPKLESIPNTEPQSEQTPTTEQNAQLEQSPNTESNTNQESTSDPSEPS